jgi:predicted hydrocarbon binding protein
VNPFFVMPGAALLSLREELEILEGDWAGETLERMGYKAGSSMVTSLEVPLPSLENFAEVFTQLWSESGLSRTKVMKVTPDEIVVTFDESLESAHGRRCDFTRGYLAGITSALLSRRYMATEVVCMSQGAEKCVHHLVPSEQMYSPPAKTHSGTPRINLEEGCSYLIESEDPKQAFEIFEDYLAHGHPGMCIVREYPEKLKKNFRLEGAFILWLSYETDMGGAREPTNIPLIYSEIKNFLDSQQGAVFILSGLEYLVSQTNFNKVLKFVQLLSEAAAVTNSIFLLPISIQTMTIREVKMLEREFREITSTNAPDGRLELLKLEE